MRTLITRDFEAAFGEVDVLVSPTTPTTAFTLGERIDDPLAMYLADLCTIPSNLYGGPALSVPCGLADDGLPVGLQVMAPVMATTGSTGSPPRLRARSAPSFRHIPGDR